MVSHDRAVRATERGHLDLDRPLLSHVDRVMLDKCAAVPTGVVPAGAAIAQRLARGRGRIAVVEAVDILHQPHAAETQFGGKEHRRQIRSAPPQQDHPTMLTDGAEARNDDDLMVGQRLPQRVAAQ